MRVYILSLLIFWFSSAHAQPTEHWARSRTIDIENIQLDLRFNWDQRRAYGTARIKAKPFVPTNILPLDAARLTIESIKLPNGTVLPFDYNGSEEDNALKIHLDHDYAPGELIDVFIQYHTNHVNEIDPTTLGGNNGKGLRFSRPTTNDPLKPFEVWSMSEPQANRYWFPSYDSPNDWRTTEIHLTVPANFTALASGVLTYVSTNPDKTQTFSYKASPHPNHLTSIVVGEYVDSPVSFNHLTVHNYGYPREKAATTASVERVGDMMRYFSDKTGVPYPFDSYSQVFVQDLPWGMGYHSLAVQSENMVDDEGTHEDFLYLWDALEGETLAQQWVGNYVCFADWSDVWITKGLSAYMSRLYNENKNGHAEFLLYQPANDLGTYLYEWNAGVHHPIATKHYDNIESHVTADNHPTLKASLVLHMLRKHLGDDRWWKAIHLFLTRNQYSSVTTESFRRAVEEASGEPMDWFFDQWFYSMGHPIFEVSQEYSATNHTLRITLIQTQQPDSVKTHPQVTYFRGRMDIAIDNTIHQVWLNPAKENTFTFSVSTRPNLVSVDYEGTWIKEIRFEKSLDELLYQAEHDNDVLGRRWAMQQLAVRAKEPGISKDDKARICTSLRNVASADLYWRLRLNALSQLQGIIAPFTEIKAVPIDAQTIDVLLHIVEKEKSWLKSSAIGFLGMTRDPRYADIYIRNLYDRSDRVVNQAAIALGKCKSPKAFAELSKLPSRPSWKNQSLMSALNGLAELGDQRGYRVAYEALSNSELHRWRLPTGSVWDVRVFAVSTIVSLGRSRDVYPLLKKRFEKSLVENDLEGIFFGAHLIATAGAPEGLEVFKTLREKYKEDAARLQAVVMYEDELKARLK